MKGWRKGISHPAAITIFLCVTILISILDRMVMNFSLPYIGKELGLNEAALGQIVSIFSVGYVLMQLPGGWLADRIGSKYILSASMLIWSVFTMFTGLAGSFIGLLVVRFLFGIGEGAAPAALVKSVSEYFQRDDRPRRQGILRGMDTVGSGLAPMVAPFLILALGWRQMYMVIGVLGIVVAILLFLFLPSSTQSSSTKSNPRKSSLLSTIKSPMVWKIGLSWFGILTTIIGYITWMPTYLNKVKGVELTETGIYMGLATLIGLGFAILGGEIVGRYLSSWTIPISIAVAIVGSLLLFIGFTTPSAMLALICLASVTIPFSLLMGVVWALPHKLIPPEQIGASAGVINLVGQVGAIISPATVGYLITLNGGSYTASTFFMLSGSVLFILSMFLLRPHVTTSSAVIKEELA